MIRKTQLAITIAAFLASNFTFAAESASSENTQPSVKKLETIVVVASADASADGLMPEYEGGQVAKGGRVGIFGNQNNLDTPFHLTSYTNQYIQQHHARSVGEVLQGDPSVRVARGFGNFQESYFVRGFLLGSDDTAYNGLYSILPRQYIPSELFERVEVFKGASTFLNGSTPSSGGIGGAINLLPKRAGNEPLNRITVGTDFNGGNIATDMSRRFGEDEQFGIRVNTAYRGENTPIDNEKAKLGLVAVGLDYHGDQLRLSGDMGFSDNRLNATRPNVTLSGVTSVPRAPESSSNYAQNWSYSNEEDIFGSYRAEYDITDAITAYAAYGFRLGEEKNSLANYTLNNSQTGAGSFYRFDNGREDTVNTGEVGIRGQFYTGSIEHNTVLSASVFDQKIKNAYAMDFSNSFANNLYQYQQVNKPSISNSAFIGNDVDHPKLNRRTRLQSIAIGDQIKALDDRVILMLGARYQKMINDEYAYNTGTHSKTYDDDKISPAVGVTYKLTPEWSIYGNYAESLTKGDTAPSTATNSIGKTLDPYVAKQKEVGLKFDNDTLGMTVDYFTTNKQRGIVTNGTFLADGKDTHQGIELHSYGKLTDNLKILGGITWLDAKQKDTTNGVFDGKRVIGVPEIQANLEATWQLPLPEDVSVNGRVVYTGKQFADNANALEAPAWTRFDLGASYKTNISNVPTVVNMTLHNLLDKNYWASVGGYDDQGYLNAGQPRTLTLSASFDF